MAGYSAWHFFMDGVFLNKISLDWPTTGQLSRLLQNFLITLPAGSYFLSLDMLQNEFPLDRFLKS